MDPPGLVGKATAIKANVARIEMVKDMGSCILHKLVLREASRSRLGREWIWTCNGSFSSKSVII